MLRTMLLAAIALAMLVAEKPTGLAQDRLSDWRGRPSIEFTHPQAEQSSTLRVIRSSGDLTEAMNDQGTVIGWGKAAAEGKVKPREEPTEPEKTIEILKRKDAREAFQRK
jgi:hypothetical protein